MPTYFRELVALTEGGKNAKLYDKGPLSAWAIATIGYINMEVAYVPAAEKGVVDFLSRYQLLGRNEFFSARRSATL